MVQYWTIVIVRTISQSAKRLTHRDASCARELITDRRCVTCAKGVELFFIAERYVMLTSHFSEFAGDCRFGSWSVSLLIDEVMEATTGADAQIHSSLSLSRRITQLNDIAKTWLGKL